MKRGRKPIPTKLKLLSGNPGKRPLNKKEPQPSPGLPECPEFLSDEAKIEWEKICFQLKGMGILARSDKHIIALLSESWADWKLAREEIKKHGRWIFTKKEDGETRTINYQFLPWMSLEKRSKSEILKYSTELGLTPSARTRLTTDALKDEDAQNELEAILK